MGFRVWGSDSTSLGFYALGFTVTVTFYILPKRGLPGHGNQGYVYMCVHISICTYMIIGFKLGNIAICPMTQDQVEKKRGIMRKPGLSGCYRS